MDDDDNDDDGETVPQVEPYHPVSLGISLTRLYNSGAELENISWL